MFLHSLQNTDITHASLPSCPGAPRGTSAYVVSCLLVRYAAARSLLCRLSARRFHPRAFLRACVVPIRPLCARVQSLAPVARLVTGVGTVLLAKARHTREHARATRDSTETHTHGLQCLCAHFFTCWVLAATAMIMIRLYSSACGHDAPEAVNRRRLLGSPMWTPSSLRCTSTSVVCLRRASVSSLPWRRPPSSRKTSSVSSGLPQGLTRGSYHARQTVVIR